MGLSPLQAPEAGIWVPEIAEHANLPRNEAGRQGWERPGPGGGRRGQVRVDGQAIRRSSVDFPACLPTGACQLRKRAL